MFGNLLAKCPQMGAHPLTADVTPPYATAQLNIVLAVTFARPGRYDLHRVKIGYITDGHHGWQYQNLNTTMEISAARKDAKPQFTGCVP